MTSNQAYMTLAQLRTKQNLLCVQKSKIFSLHLNKSMHIPYGCLVIKFGSSAYLRFRSSIVMRFLLVLLLWGSILCLFEVDFHLGEMCVFVVSSMLVYVSVPILNICIDWSYSHV